MSGAQFMCIIGTIYMVPDMDPEYRKWAGFACFVLAIVLDIFGK